MSYITVAIGLTIPDNESRTAYSTLRRLGVELSNLDRAELLIIEAGDAAAVEAAVRQNEALFNENTHALWCGVAPGPSVGELWICDDVPLRVALSGFESVIRLRGYRLTKADGSPCAEAVVSAAAELLLCNPAVQRRVHVLTDLFTGVATTR